MIKWYVRIIGLTLLLIGLWGFRYPEIPGLVHLDLWQCFIYLIFGGLGIQFGFFINNIKSQRQYLTAVGIIGLIFLAFGLTFPNFFDIFHFEVAEDLFHLILGVLGCVVGTRKEI